MVYAVGFKNLALMSLRVAQLFIVVAIAVAAVAVVAVAVVVQLPPDEHIKREAKAHKTVERLK